MTGLVAGMAVDRRGTGEPLVLIHGLGSWRQVWNPVLDGVAAERDVIAVDLPGFGDSPGPAPVDRDGVASVAAFADRIEALITDLGLGRPRIAGSSLGGGIALELGRRAAVRAVTAFAPIGFWTGFGAGWSRHYVGAARQLARRSGPALRPLLGTPAGRAVAGGLFLGRPWSADGGQLLADAAALARAPGFGATATAFAGHRFPAGDLGALRDLPVILVWGTRDLVLPFTPQARRARLALPQARRVLLPGAGHLPFSDAPAACIAVLLS